MPVFKFTSPDGKTYSISGPEGATNDQAFGILKQQIDAGNGDQFLVKNTDTAKVIDTQLSDIQSQLQTKGNAGELNKPAYQPEVPQNETVGNQQRLSPDMMTPEEKAARANGVPFTPDLETPEFKQQREMANRAVQVTQADIDKEAASRKAHPELYKNVPEGSLAFDAAKRRKIGKEAEMVGTAFSAPLNPMGSVAGGLGLAGRIGGQGLIAAANNAIGQAIGTGEVNPEEAAKAFTLGGAGQGIAEAAIPALKAVTPVASKGLDLLANIAGVSNVKKAVGEATSNVANAVADKVLPEEVRTAQKANSLAKRANKDTVQAIAGNGNEVQHNTVQQLIKDEQGNSLLTPMQMYSNTGKGKDIIQAEKTGFGKGGSQDYQNVYDKQQSGNLFENIIGDTSNARTGVQNPLQQALDADKIVAADKYNSVMQNLNDTFNNGKVRIKSIKTPETNMVIDNIIDNESRLSSGVSAETKRFLNNQVKKFEPSSPEEINTLKTTINQRIGDNMVNGKPSASAQALMKVRDAYKVDTDNFMNGIGQGNLWREADKHYKEMMGDFSGKNNPVAKALKQDVEQGNFGNQFVSGQNAAYNTTQAIKGLQNSAGRTSTDLSQEFSQGIGNLSRANALENASINHNFDLNKLVNNLNKQAPSVKAGDVLTGTNEAAKNQAISDVANLFNKYKTKGEYNPNVGSAELLSGAIARGSVNPTLAAIGAADRMLGENALFNAAVYGKRIARDREFLSNPKNAEMVLNIMNGNGHAVTPESLKSAIDAVDTFQKSILPNVAKAARVVNQNGTEPQQSIPETPSTPQPSMVNQVPDVSNATNPNANPVEEQKFSKRTQILADAISNAETGNETDPWIFNKVKGSGSSAAGPLQITKGLMEDMLNRHPDLFTDNEKRYMRKYIKQGELMLQNPNDPVFGYGGKGIMFNTDAQKKMYMNIGKKLLDQTYKDSGNDINRFITKWRGVSASQDPRYHNIVSRGIEEGIKRYS